MKVFHYTSDKGFEGIVLNQCIRLTQSTQSNDKTDTIHIHEIIKDNIDYFQINDDIKDNRVIQMVLDIFNRFEEERFVEGEQEKSDKAFIVSLTTKGDNRLLWTSYSNDEGYCIGFNLDKFKLFLGDVVNQIQIFKDVNTFFMSGIIYNEENKKALIKDIIKDEYNKIISDSDEGISANIPTIVMPYQFIFTDENDKVIYSGEKRVIEIKLKKRFEILTRRIINSLLFISPILKNEYWEDEGEIRLIFYRPVISDTLTPIKTDEKQRNYVELLFDKGIIEDIIIGPMNNKTIEDVKKDLQDAGYSTDKINVRYSSGKSVLRKRGK